MRAPLFHHHLTIPLPHHGDCSLLGVTPEGHIYVEEIYADDGWLAQHCYTSDGGLLRSVDELEGQNTTVQPLELPDDLIKPKTGWHTMALNFTGARHRGMRVNERLSDLVQPLSIADKMALSGRLKLQPMQVVGVAESYVLAEIELIHPHLFLTCRRIRFAYALPAEQIDADGEPYDYDTLVIYALHLFDLTLEEERPLSTVLNDLPGLSRPMDCLLHDNWLYIAEGGSAERSSSIQVWRVEWLDKPLPPDEALQKKIYG